MQGTPIHPVSMPELRAVLEHAPVGAIVVDSGSRILYANVALKQMLGYDDHLIGQTLTTLLPDSIAGHHGALVSGFFDTPRQRQMGAGRLLYARHRAGHDVAVEIALSPARMDGDAVAIGYVSDISVVRLAQMQFGQVVAAMPQGVLLVDLDGIIRLTNPVAEQQFGFGPGDLIGQPLDNLLPHRYRAGHGDLFRTYAANARPRMMGEGRDLTALHRSGLEFPVEIALSRIDTPGGARLLAIVSDISSRKRVESALRQTNAQLEEFTYVASHDLRSPLRGIADLLSWIREDLRGTLLPDSVLNNFERIDIRITRTERMIEDLLEYARAGKRTPRQDDIDPVALVDEVMGLVPIPPGFRVERDISGPPFPGARTPLALSLRNLLSNAIKHHGQDSGLVRISMRDEGRYAVFSVEDDGQGIPDSAQERIFKLFHRANTSVVGHGVGLAVTRRMINAHDGMITVEGHGALGGASFHIHWPRIALKETSDE